MNSFKIYTPQRKAFFTNDIKMLLIAIGGSLSLFFLIIVLKQHDLSWFLVVLSIFFVFAFFVLSLYYAFSGLYKNKVLEGTIEGDITFEGDRIIVNNKEYLVSALKKISFTCFDDYVDRMDTSRHTFNNRKSNGVDNIIELYFEDGKKLAYNFQLIKRYQLRDIREQLINYHNTGKLHFLQLIAILGIEDYNAIQNFKETIKQIIHGTKSI